MNQPPSGFTVPEQIRDALVEAFVGSKDLVNSCSFACYFVGDEVRLYCFVELSGAANALNGEQRENGLRIVLLQLALLPLLNGPCGCAHVIHRISEVFQYARLHAAGFDRLLDLGKRGAGLPELVIHPPKSLVGDQKLDSNPQDSAIFGTALSNNTRLSCFARKEIG